MKRHGTIPDELVARNTILLLLSDDEVASVSTAETALSLQDGAEFIDLELLEKGVLKASGATAIMGRVLPRKAVHEVTWKKILKVLATITTPAA